MLIAPGHLVTRKMIAAACDSGDLPSHGLDSPEGLLPSRGQAASAAAAAALVAALGTPSCEQKRRVRSPACTMPITASRSRTMAL